MSPRRVHRYCQDCRAPLAEEEDDYCVYCLADDNDEEEAEEDNDGETSSDEAEYPYE